MSPAGGVGAPSNSPLGSEAVRLGGMELVIAPNPDPESTLPYLLWLPLGGGLVFRTKGTWPRTNALYCYPVPADEWPEDPDVVERVPRGRLRPEIRQAWLDAHTS